MVRCDAVLPVFALFLIVTLATITLEIVVRLNSTTSSDDLSIIAASVTADTTRTRTHIHTGRERERELYRHEDFLSTTYLYRPPSFDTTNVRNREVSLYLYSAST